MARTRTLYLIRHAIAAARGPEWPDDGLRPVTVEGANRMKRIVAGFARLGDPPDRILTSPLVRARQTADLVARGFDPRPPVQVLPALAPGTPASRIISAVAIAGRGASRIALVGHEPGLGELAARLVGARTPMVFKKGGIARIDVDGWAPADAGRLIWLATPKLLRRARA